MYTIKIQHIYVITKKCDVFNAPSLMSIFSVHRLVGECMRRGVPFQIVRQYTGFVHYFHFFFLLGTGERVS